MTWCGPPQCVIHQSRVDGRQIIVGLLASVLPIPGTVFLVLFLHLTVNSAVTILQAQLTKSG
jgi:hypothetical protein